MPESPGPSDGPATYVPPAYDPRSAAYLVPRPENAVHPMGIVLSARPARRPGRSIAATVIVAAVAVAGWVLFAPGSQDSKGSTERPLASGSSFAFPEPTLAPPGPGGRLGVLLETIAIQDRDFPADYTVQLAPAGDQVHGQATLDNCNYRFTTEAHRVARREYMVIDASGRNTGVGNELVAYDSAAQAARAVAQWHQAAAGCPRGPVRSAGTVAVVRVSRNEIRLAALPNATNALTVESATVTGKGRAYTIVVLQVRGRILDAIFVVDTNRPTSHDVDNAVRMAALAGRRLAASG